MENDSYVKIAGDAVGLLIKLKLITLSVPLNMRCELDEEAAEMLDALFGEIANEGITKRYFELEQSEAGDRERAEAYASEVCDE